MPKYSDLRDTLRKYYAHVFCYDFIFGYAIFPAYFQLQGTKPETIGLLLAFWAAGIILLEIPSGLLSDIVDRRWLLGASPFFKATCFVIWALADDQVWMYFGGIFFWSLASALQSGTKEALLYEHVHANKMGRRYLAIVGWERAYRDGATMLGTALGGFVAYQNLQLALWVSLIPLCVSSITALSIAELGVRKGYSDRDTSFPEISSLLKSTWQEFSRKPNVRYITGYIALGVAFLETLEDFNQLFFLAIDLPVWTFGLIAGVIGIARIILATQADKLCKFGALSWVSPLCCGVGLWGAGLNAQMQFFSLFTLILAYIFAAPQKVLAISQFQTTLSGVSRATTTSLMSICIEIWSVVVNLVMAFLIAQYSVLSAFQICGLYLLVFAVWEIVCKNNG